MTNEMIIEQAKKVLSIESIAIASLKDRIGNSFVIAVNLLSNSHGRIVVTGMGKSGIIGKKIAATLASIGVPAIFLHAAEAIHGDLGMIVKGDIIIAISNSGETEEIIELLPTIKRFDVKLIAITGNINSTLAKSSDVVLDISVKEEACPLGLVPTASTTASLAMGDAIAIALLCKKGVKEEDFAKFHPGGRLGKRLLLTVDDLMHKGNQVPIVTEATSIKDVVFEISSKKLGVTTVVNNKGALTGIITDGDLRRLMEKRSDFSNCLAIDAMNRNPKVIDKNLLATKAIEVMEKYSITSLIIIDGAMHPEGIIHLHDTLKAGIV